MGSYTELSPPHLPLVSKSTDKLNLNGHRAIIARSLNGKRCSSKEGEHPYWFCIVGPATSHEPRTSKIQGPIGNTRTFAFHAGRAKIAIVSQVNVETGKVLDP